MDYGKSYFDVLKKYVITQKKLKIAVACLKRMTKDDECSGCMDCMSSAYAERALEKIKEIK